MIPPNPFCFTSPVSASSQPHPQHPAPRLGRKKRPCSEHTKHEALLLKALRLLHLQESTSILGHQSGDSSRAHLDIPTGVHPSSKYNNYIYYLYVIMRCTEISEFPAASSVRELLLAIEAAGAPSNSSKDGYNVNTPNIYRAPTARHNPCKRENLGPASIWDRICCRTAYKTVLDPMLTMMPETNSALAVYQLRKIRKRQLAICTCTYLAKSRAEPALSKLYLRPSTPMPSAVVSTLQFDEFVHDIACIQMEVESDPFHHSPETQPYRCALKCSCLE